MAKFTKGQKIVEWIVFFVIIAAGIYKVVYASGDRGSAVILSFVTVLLFAVFTVASLFPATWRMTEKEKKKIDEPIKYQERYTTIFVAINTVISIFMVLLLLFIG